MSTIAHSSSVATPATLSISAPTKRGRLAPPPIPPDKEPQLYNAFFDGQSSLVDIAREFNLSVTHLVAWTAQQHVKTKLLNVAELGRTRARLLASEGCGRAVHTLDTISTFHMSDIGDAKTTNAHAKRKDVSRKSATDTLKIGLHPLNGLFNYINPDNDRVVRLSEPDVQPPQPEGLSVQSRGVERGSASDTPGKHAQIQPHSEGVHVPHRAEEPKPVPRVAGMHPRHSENTSDPTPPPTSETNQAPQPGTNLAATPDSQTTTLSTIETPPNTHTTPNPTPPQPKGLTAHSRGVERGSASDTPGRNAESPSHPEGINEPHNAQQPSPRAHDPTCPSD